MSKRTYAIQFPYQTSWVQRLAIHHGLKDPKYQDDLKELKPDLRAKLETCDSETKFTKADFDGIPDKIWVKLADYIK